MSEVIETERDVHGEGWMGRRLLLADDGTGYSLHETTLEAGVELRFEYVRHRETVYCLEGEGSVEDVASGRRAPLRPGSLYSAGIGEPHVVRRDARQGPVCLHPRADRG